MGRRHLLIIATQCGAMSTLDDLDAGALALEAALVDDTRGACEPGLPDGRAACLGPQTAQEVTNTVLAAAQHAADNDATLVLALLGHGFVPGSSTQMYYMGHDSQDQVRATAVDVRSLLTAVIDDTRIPGVIVIVDTCMAAGAVPPIEEIIAGTRAGRGKVAMLLAAGVRQPAYDLQVSRALADILQQGLPGAGARLDVAAVKPRLQQLALGQSVARFEYDSAPGTSEGLWLGHNRQHLSAPGTAALGPLARSSLDEAVTTAPISGAPVAAWDHNAVAALAREQATDAGPFGEHARRVASIVVATMRSAAFVRTTLGRKVTTAKLQQAMARVDALGMPRSVTGLDPEPANEQDFLEVVALRRTGAAWPAPRSLAFFMVALADAAGVDPNASEFDDWARAVGASVHLNDAREAVRSANEHNRLRLVVSLHASLTGDRWPESLEAWLVDETADPGRRQIPCTPSQLGVEEALREAVEWAEDEAGLRNLRLQRVDVAVPTGLLVQWRPEEAVYGRRLGIDYDVLTRWSRRLTPDRNQGWIITGIRRQLEDGPAELGWLPDHLAQELAELGRQLQAGRYTYAVGLTRPPVTTEVLDLLLAHVPILLWPQAGVDFLQEQQRHLHGCWGQMPQALNEAYRRRWQLEDPNPVADLRAVWDDLDWVRFCAGYRRTRVRRS